MPRRRALPQQNARKECHSPQFAPAASVISEGEEGSKRERWWSMGKQLRVAYGDRATDARMTWRGVVGGGHNDGARGNSGATCLNAALADDPFMSNVQLDRST